MKRKPLPEITRPEVYCPTCKASFRFRDLSNCDCERCLDIALNSPKPGDMAVCANCYELVAFDKDLPHVMTAAQWIDFFNADMVTAIQVINHRKWVSEDEGKHAVKH